MDEFDRTNLESLLSQSLRDSVQNIRREATRWLDHPQLHPTDHSIHHSERIVKLLCLLLGRLMQQPRTDTLMDLQPLNEHEIFTLLAASFLHDVGMFAHDDGLDAQKTRDEHHQASHDLIISCGKPKGVDFGVPREYIDDVALVARGHRDLDLLTPTYTSHFFNANANLRVGLLSALLRVANMLDVGSHRVDIQRLSASQLDPLTQMRWYLHYYVQAIGLVHGNVQVHFRIPASSYDKYGSLVPAALLKSLRERLEPLRDMLWNYDVQLNVPASLERHKCLKRSIDEMPQAMLDEMDAYVRHGPQGERQQRRSRRDTKAKILLLAANPKNTTSLRLGQESRCIDEALQMAGALGRIEVIQQWAVRVDDVQKHMLRHEPDVVHFIGHGEASGEIVLEDAVGNSRPVTAEALGEMFKALNGNVQCVVLNACYSASQADAIAKYVGCVVGMARPIDDDAAIAFATAFYRGLGFGRDVASAFALGLSQLALEKQDRDVPTLLAGKCKPENVSLL